MGSGKRSCSFIPSGIEMPQSFLFPDLYSRHACPVRYPLITISNAELRRELQLPSDRTVFSYMHLVSHQHLLQLIGDLANIEQGRKMRQEV